MNAANTPEHKVKKKKRQKSTTNNTSHNQFCVFHTASYFYILLMKWEKNTTLSKQSQNQISKS